MKNVRLFFFSLLLLTFIGLLDQSFSQSIYFCEGVDDEGDPINESSLFTIPESGGFLYVLIQLPYEIGCKKVNLEVYRNDDYDNTISIDTQRNWKWFWKKITFYKSGVYIIDVYDCNDELIIFGTVEINMD
jgi:hypothetical protein